MARSPELGTIPGLASSFSPETSLEMFRRMCLIRYFELVVARELRTKRITQPVYLSIGQEAPAVAMSTVISGYHIFAQHRAHSFYLAFGGEPVKLIDELLERPTGCNGGRGGSAMIQDLNINMIGHNGLIGENVPLAVGYALGSNEKTVAIFGDAAAEEDYIYGSMGFAATHKLPVLFVCEDNDLAILTKVSVRRNWEMANVAKALGIPAVDITDDPWLVAHHTRELCQHLPAFINCRTVRHYWHVGVGIDGPPEWDRLALVRQQMKKLGLETEKIEQDTKESVEKLWAERLRKQ